MTYYLPWNHMMQPNPCTWGASPRIEGRGNSGDDLHMAGRESFYLVHSLKWPLQKVFPKSCHINYSPPVSRDRLNTLWRRSAGKVYSAIHHHSLYSSSDVSPMGCGK